MKNNIKLFRVQLGLTQDELAKSSGVARTVVNQLETGVLKVVKSDTMVKIATALHQPLGAVFFTEEV